MKNSLDKLLATLFLTFSAFVANAQVFDNLPVGKYNVGFTIITFIDSSRVTDPLYNYFGERETIDRHKKISVHVWYPSAQSNAKTRRLAFRDYTSSHLLKSLDNELTKKDQQLAEQRIKSFLLNNFSVGAKKADSLLSLSTLAARDLSLTRGEFPLIIGVLRQFSTTITNEMLASNGYIVAMVKGSVTSYPAGYIEDVQDIRFAVHMLKTFFHFDEDNLGTYGFSGSGFSQLIFAMNDPRVRAIADLESAYYTGAAWSQISSSNHYNVRNLRIPFMHFARGHMVAQDDHLNDFYRKIYSERYRILVNAKSFHHWDFAAEGRLASLSSESHEGTSDIKVSFEVVNKLLLIFFDAYLKSDKNMHDLISQTSDLRKMFDGKLWTMEHLRALEVPPSRDRIVELIQRIGIDAAIGKIRAFHKKDSLWDAFHENQLNFLASQYSSQGNNTEAVALMRLAVEFYPNEAWLWLNLAGYLEANKNVGDAIHACATALRLLANDNSSAGSFNGRIKTSAQAMHDRLTKTKLRSEHSPGNQD